MATKDLEELRAAAEGASLESVEAARRMLLAARRGDLEGAISARVLSFLADSVATMDRAELARAASATSNLEALLPLVEVGAVRMEEPGPLVRARLRGIRRKREILEKGEGAVGTKEAAEMLGVSTQAVDKRRERGRILALPVGGGRHAFPVWQFDERGRDGMVPGLAETLDSFSVADPWMRAEFMLADNERLGGRSPLRALEAGDVEAVKEVAAAYGEHGAQ